MNACVMKNMLRTCACCLFVVGFFFVPANGECGEASPRGGWNKPGKAGWVIENEMRGAPAYGKLSWSSNINGRAAIVIRGGAATDRPVTDRIHGPNKRWSGSSLIDLAVHSISFKFYTEMMPPGALGLYFRGKSDGKTLEWLCEVSGFKADWVSYRVPLSPVRWWNEQGHMTADDFNAAASSVEEIGVWLVYQRLVPRQVYAIDDFRMEAGGRGKDGDPVAIHSGDGTEEKKE